MRTTWIGWRNAKLRFHVVWARPPFWSPFAWVLQIGPVVFRRVRRGQRIPISRSYYKSTYTTTEPKP